MRLVKTHWRAIRRYILVFTAIALLPLGLIYLVRNDQIYKIKGYEGLNDKKLFAEQSFRYPVLLLGKNKELATGPPKKKIPKHQKYINESHVPVLPEESIHTLSPNEFQLVEQRMENRRRVLHERCTEHGLDVVGNDSLHEPNAWEYLVNRKYHIIWCNVFKAASSSWMYNFNILAGYSPSFLHKTKENFLSLAREQYPRLSLKELQLAQNDSITFIIARHPFERLLSAYRDKFVFALPRSHHDQLGRKIIKAFRKKNGDHIATKYPSFPEFVRWLLHNIKANNFIDMHFISSTRFCTPCLINFDVIMKFETLEQDQLYLLEKTGLKRAIAPEWRNRGHGKTRELIQTFYSQLTRHEVLELYEYYKYDFELYDYSVDEYFQIAKKDPEEEAPQTSDKDKQIKNNNDKFSNNHNYKRK